MYASLFTHFDEHTLRGNVVFNLLFKYFFKV